MSEHYDAIVIGAGHNGLVCASLLGKAGRKVLVLEANDQVGGAAVTREFADGYSTSACAHLLYQLQPQVQKDLGLKVDLASDEMGTVALSPDGNHVRINGKEVYGVSDEDQASYRAFHKRMTRFADLLKTYLNRTPPRLAKDASKADMMNLARLGFDIRRLGRREMQAFLRLIGMNIRDEMVERFDSGLLRGAISLDAVMGTHLGPRSPNTILTYLYRLAGTHGRVAQPNGGMSSVTEALAQVARGRYRPRQADVDDVIAQRRGHAVEGGRQLADVGVPGDFWDNSAHVFNHDGGLLDLDETAVLDPAREAAA